MSEKKDNGGAAFPAHDYLVGDITKDGFQKLGSTQGMTLRQYAAIHLKQPDSGAYWLDEMILKAKRDELAAAAMQGLIKVNAPHEAGKLRESYAAESYLIADATLAERSK